LLYLTAHAVVQFYPFNNINIPLVDLKNQPFARPGTRH